MQRVRGPIFRLMAVIGDLACAYTLHSLLSSYEQLGILNKNIQLWMITQLKVAESSLALLDWGAFLVLLYFIYIGFRLYSTLIFGVSFSQWIIGIRGTSNRLWNRIGGMVRVILELPLAPFLFFDLPCWFKKKTIKEWLSFTELYVKDNVFIWLVSFVIIPLMAVGSLFSPMLINLTVLDGILLDRMLEKKDALTNESNFSAFAQYSSNYYKLSSFTGLKDNRFLLIPNFIIEKTKNRNRVTPYVTIYDKQLKATLEMKIVGDLSLLNILAEGEKANFFFARQFPRIAKILKGPRELYLPRAYEKSYQSELALSSEVLKEIRTCIQQALELSLKNLWPHVMKAGPFIKGDVLIRNVLLSVAESGGEGMPQMEVVQIGGQQFLQFRQTLTHRPLETQWVERLISVETNNIQILEFTTSLDKNAQSSLDDFKQTFFGNISWYFDYKDIFAYPTDNGALGPFSVIDFYLQNQIPPDKKSEFEDYVYHYFFDLGKYALDNSDETLRNLLLTTTMRIVDVAKLKNIKDVDYYSLRYINFMQALKMALVQNNADYFAN